MTLEFPGLTVHDSAGRGLRVQVSKIEAHYIKIRDIDGSEAFPILTVITRNADPRAIAAWQTLADTLAALDAKEDVT